MRCAMPWAYLVSIIVRIPLKDDIAMVLEGSGTDTGRAPCTHLSRLRMYDSGHPRRGVMYDKCRVLYMTPLPE